MLTLDGTQNRRRRLWERVPTDVQWLLIADPRHVHYLSNFLVQPLSFSHGERAWLLLERDGLAKLLGDNFSLRSAYGDPFVDEEVVTTWYDHQHSVMNRDHALVEALGQVASQLKGRGGLLETEWLPIAALDVLDITPSAPSLSLGDLIRELRRQKEADEIALLKRCMAATNAGHARAREVIRPGVSEFEIYREVQSAAMNAAGEPCLVYGDFRATNAASPKAGGLPTDYELQQGDLFILDYSVILAGYRSDFTNTYAVGEPSSEQRELFSLLESAMRAGEAALKAAVPARDVYNAASRPLREAGYDGIPHHAGHGIGLGHPEPPILAPHSEDVLQAGDVITLEPGLYVDGIGGIRIEHNYLITDDGYERLSGHEISLC